MKHAWAMAAIVILVSAAAIFLAMKTAADAEDKHPSRARQIDQLEQRAKLLNCYEGSVERFDDRVSPANVVADAVAWHCEAEGQSELYWIILSQRRSSPDTIDAFYRDLALPFVLRRRVARLRAG